MEGGWGDEGLGGSCEMKEKQSTDGEKVWDPEINYLEDLSLCVIIGCSAKTVLDKRKDWR